jgi:cyclophilin family peptidyl-prolyl cis-trans isomerase
MRKTLVTLLFALSSSLALAADKVPAHPHIEMVTSLGTIKLELDGRQAPITVAHILKLVDSGFYDGTIFHRVIPGFMAQGGGYTPGLKLKEKGATIANESGNGLTNLRGGSVIEGMEVVDEIVNTKTGPAGEFSRDVPVVPIIIKKVSRVTYE